VLRVTDDHGDAWLADVGFGLGTLLDPIPFAPDSEAAYEQSGWGFRLIKDGRELVLQTRVPDTPPVPTELAAPASGAAHQSTTAAT
jgi:arylamine N-acetyltransferase